MSNGTYLSPDREDTLDDALLSGRIMVGALSQLMKEGDNIIVELKYQPKYPDDPCGMFEVIRTSSQIITRPLMIE